MDKKPAKKQVPPEADQFREISIPILTGSYFNLTQFDFSFKDITIFDIQSEDFENYIESLQPNIKAQNFSLIRNIHKQINFDHDKKYAIVKNNPRENFNYQDILNVYHLLLIIFPSDLQIEHIIHYIVEKDFIQLSSLSSWDKRMTGESPGELLFASEEDVAEINEFASLYFDRLNLVNYIGIAIENYITSFTASHYHYQYLTLFIALESTISGNQELTYRLRRTVAILCGKDGFNCDLIFENLNKLYSLRSKIIHGEEYSIAKVQEYLPALKSIVSRAIIELLIHNITTNKELNAITTRLAFGDRAKITEGWKSYKLNIFTIVDSNWKQLT